MAALCLDGQFGHPTPVYSSSTALRFWIAVSTKRSWAKMETAPMAMNAVKAAMSFFMM